ncbi:MAG: hypothetical protein RL141_632 [Candidatus Parcubacteria bacterium]
MTAFGRQAAERVVGLLKQHGILQAVGEKVIPFIQDRIGSYKTGEIDVFVGALETAFTIAGDFFGWPKPLTATITELTDELGDEGRKLSAQETVTPEDTRKALDATSKRIDRRLARKQTFNGAWLLIAPEEQHVLTQKVGEFNQDPSRCKRLNFWRAQLGWSPRLLVLLQNYPLHGWEIILTEYLGPYEEKVGIDKALAGTSKLVTGTLEAVLAAIQDPKPGEVAGKIRTHVHDVTKKLDAGAKQQLREGDDLEALFNE